MDGPVRVLEHEEPFRSFWSVDDIQGRWLVRRFDVQAVGGVRVPVFSADTVGPCGEDPLPVPRLLWPITVGETLVGCDVTDGTVYALDPDSEARGRALAADLQCEPLRRFDTRVAMLDTRAGTLVLFDDAGDVTPTSIPYQIPEDDLDPLAAYLNNPLQSQWQSFGLLGEESILVHDAANTLWRLDVGSGDHEVFREHVEAFALDPTTGLLAVLDDREVEPGRGQVTIVDPNSGDERAGPLVEDLRMTWGYVAFDAGVFDVADGVVYPYPRPLAEGEFVVADADGRVQIFGARLVVWDPPTGAILVDVEAGENVCGFGPTIDDVLFVRWGNDTCRRSELWSYPLDGSDPELIHADRSPQVAFWLSADELLVEPLALNGPPGEIIYENRRTGASWLIDDKVGGTVTGVGVAIGHADRGDNELLYHVEDGDRSGLWRSELPR